MSSHQIELTDLEDFVIAHELCSSHGRGESKRIMLVVTGSFGKEYGRTTLFRVYDHGQLVIETGVEAIAVDAYNSIGAK